MAASIIGGRNVDAGRGLRVGVRSWFVSRETCKKRCYFLKKRTKKLLIISGAAVAGVSGPKG
jgi:hypothetical protein